METSAEQLAKVAQELRGISRLFRAVLALAPGLVSPLPGLSQFSQMAGIAQILLSKQSKEVVVNQNITINIGEGQISERAFWDDLVMRHLVPSLERGGVSPVPEGGAG